MLDRRLSSCGCSGGGEGDEGAGGQGVLQVKCAHRVPRMQFWSESANNSNNRSNSLQHAATPGGSSLVLGKEITAVEAVAVRGGEGVEQRLEVAGRV